MHCASLQSRLGKGLCPRSAVSLPAAAPATLRRHKPAACAALVLPPLSLQRGRHRGDLPALVHQLGLEQAVLNQPWVELSVRCCLPACLPGAAAAHLRASLHPRLGVGACWHVSSLLSALGA